jgi:23S rRNA pseudouridine955/2504/2580 synthase
MSWKEMPSPDNNNGVRIETVDTDHDGQRVDNYLASRLKGLPRSRLYRLIRTGQVRINGKRCKPASRLSEGDQVRIPPARVASREEVPISERVIEQLRSCILHQDGSMLIVDKPSGMAVHAGSGLPWGIIDVLRRMFPGEFIELVHRLDRETSGCLLLARNGAALKRLSEQFRAGEIGKRYLCLMDGRLPEAELLTGRTHQIRVHARHLGLPLAGDPLYSERESMKRWRARGLKRIFLHAHLLQLEGDDGRMLEFSAPLPAELRSVLDSLE